VLEAQVMLMGSVVQSFCDEVRMDGSVVGRVWLTMGLGKTGCLTLAHMSPTGGVGVQEAHSETLVKQGPESRRWRAITVVQAACATTLVRERMSLRRELTSAVTDACTMQSSSVDAGLARACSPAREASAPREMGARASL
jgi:hypothetical protein